MEKNHAISANLKQIRQLQGLSQEALAKEAGISRVALGNIESGKSEPRVETLVALASALNVRLEELLSPPPVLEDVRFRARKTLKRRDQVLFDVARRLRDYVELEELLDAAEPCDFAIPKKLQAGRGVPNAVAAAKAARKAVGLKPNETIRDICGLLEDNGVKVFPVELASDAFFGLSVGPKNGGPAVAVNVWKRISVERWIFSAAHELGHILLHLGDSFDVRQAQEVPEEEKEADAFASHFLMPDEVFQKEWHEARGLDVIERVVKVKRIFRVSYATVLYRISETHPIGKEVWKRFHGAYKAKFGRSLDRKTEISPASADEFSKSMSADRSADEPERLLSSDFQSDRLARLVRDGIEQDVITLARGAEILGDSLGDMRRRASSWL